MPITQPSFIPQPWASGNSSYYDDVPAAAADAAPGRASWEAGYPTSTSLPLDAGGYAPARLDFNGGLNAISAHVFFSQSGSLYQWANSRDYNVGSHILGSDGKEYVCIAANGVSGTIKNPVNDTNHAYWKPLTLYITDLIYPVGSIYMTTANTNPGTLFGGTWQKIQDRYLLGSGVSRSATETGGTSTYTLTVNNMPQHNHAATAANNGAHTHTTTGTAASDGAHTHGVGTLATASTGAHTHTATTASNGAHTHGVGMLATASSGAHTHTRGTMEITGSIVANDLSGGGNEPFTEADSFTNSGALKMGNPITITDVPQRKTTPSGNTTYNSITLTASDGWSGATSSAGAHTHTISGATASAGAHTHTLTTSSAGAHTHTISGATASSGAHTHTTSGTAASAGSHTHTTSGTAASAGSHTHTITVGNKGGNTAFSIMPPYYVVNIWRRTA